MHQLVVPTFGVRCLCYSRRWKTEKAFLFRENLISRFFTSSNVFGNAHLNRSSSWWKAPEGGKICEGKALMYTASNAANVYKRWKLFTMYLAQVTTHWPELDKCSLFAHRLHAKSIASLCCRIEVNLQAKLAHTGSRVS